MGGFFAAILFTKVSFIFAYAAHILTFPIAWTIGTALNF